MSIKISQCAVLAGALGVAGTVVGDIYLLREYSGHMSDLMNRDIFVGYALIAANAATFAMGGGMLGFALGFTLGSGLEKLVQTQTVDKKNLHPED